MTIKNIVSIVILINFSFSLEVSSQSFEDNHCKTASKIIERMSRPKLVTTNFKIPETHVDNKLVQKFYNLSLVKIDESVGKLHIVRGENDKNLSDLKELIVEIKGNANIILKSYWEVLLYLIRDSQSSDFDCSNFSKADKARFATYLLYGHDAFRSPEELIEEVIVGKEAEYFYSVIKDLRSGEYSFDLRIFKEPDIYSLIVKGKDKAKLNSYITQIISLNFN